MVVESLCGAPAYFALVVLFFAMVSTPAATLTENGNTASPSAAVKTIYLIRHAESEENRRVGSLKSAAKAVARFSWPSSKDISAALELVRVNEQIDSAVSEFGKQQIVHMTAVMKESNFVALKKIQLVAHSPLLRAKETSLGMLGCTASSGLVAVAPIETVHELEMLKERTPVEWLPGGIASFYTRMAALEDWIAERPETVIVLVGHSQFFKALLKLDYKFGNCDVMQVKFQSTEPLIGRSKWSDLQEVYTCRIQPTVIEPSAPHD